MVGLDIWVWVGVAGARGARMVPQIMATTTMAPVDAAIAMAIDHNSSILPLAGGQETPERNPEGHREDFAGQRFTRDLIATAR